MLLMGQDLFLVNRKIPVEDVEHFAFHPANVVVFKNAGAPRPNDVLHHLVIEILGLMDRMSSSMTSPQRK